MILPKQIKNKLLHYLQKSSQEKQTPFQEKQMPLQVRQKAIHYRRTTFLSLRGGPHVPIKKMSARGLHHGLCLAATPCHVACKQPMAAGLIPYTIPKHGKSQPRHTDVREKLINLPVNLKRQTERILNKNGQPISG